MPREERGGGRVGHATIPSSTGGESAWHVRWIPQRVYGEAGKEVVRRRLDGAVSTIGQKCSRVEVLRVEEVCVREVQIVKLNSSPQRKRG